MDDQVMNLQELEDLERRAEAGEAKAMHLLGMLYKEGKEFGGLSIPKDTEKAHCLLRRAAETRRANVRKALDPSRVRENIAAIWEMVDKAITRIDKGLGSLFEELGPFVIGAFAIALAVLVLWLVGSAIAVLPVSVAVIIGALIIAAALRR